MAYYQILFGTPTLLMAHLLQSLGSESRKNESGLVDLGVVVTAELLLLLLGPGAERNLDVAVGVLAADHEANLAGGVSWDRGVGVLSHGEDLLAVLLELGDQGKVEPLVLGCGNELLVKVFQKAAICVFLIERFATKRKTENKITAELCCTVESRDLPPLGRLRRDDNMNSIAGVQGRLDKERVPPPSRDFPNK